MSQPAPNLPPTAVWSAAHLGGLAPAECNIIPRVDRAACPAALAGVDLWDLWPLQLADGSTALRHGASLWFVLSAPALPDPEDRHAIVRIRLMSRTQEGEWRDHGPAMPEGLNPGSREWAGSALLDPESGTVSLFFTAAGYADEAALSFAQRLFVAHGQLDWQAASAAITGWNTPMENVISDGRHYMLVNQRSSPPDAAPGAIKGFRDPAHFTDPADGARYIVFTASVANSAHRHNGCIGLARVEGEGWSASTLLPPLVSADGLNNELERPVLIFAQGRYYLFWSTQSKVFAPTGPVGPNGIYGMVAPTLRGPWQPLNGSGLVAANPDSAPFQTYSWWVDASLDVWGFVDYPDCTAQTRLDDPDWRRQTFGGTPAPCFRLELDGTRAWIKPKP